MINPVNKKYHAVIAVLMCVNLTACEFTAAEFERQASRIVFAVKSLLGFGPGKNVPANVKNEMSDAGSPEDQKRASEFAKENSELLFEMMSVVFDTTDIANKSDFGALVHSLNQGASLEGIYRGIIMGARYRGQESSEKGASPATLKAFALEMAEVQADMKNPTVFHEGEAKKPFEIEYPEGPTTSAATPAEDRPVLKKEENALELLKMFVGASHFTLKRVLADETLKRIDEFQNSAGQLDVNALAQWYAQFAVRMAATKVDFGLKQRNEADYDFHFKWAQHMAADRVKWEVLNRDHRYINAISKLK